MIVDAGFAGCVCMAAYLRVDAAEAPRFVGVSRERLLRGEVQIAFDRKPAKGRTAMADEAKKTTGKRKRRRNRRSKEDEYASYVIGIEDWEWALSFGIDSTKYREGPYMDFRHLHLRGKLIVPSRIKAETVQAVLMPRRIADDDRYEAPEPKSVGSVSLHRGRFEALLSMPSDALAPVLQMLIAEKFRFIDLHGHRLRYGSAIIRSYRLEMNIDEEDMPADE